MRPQYSLASMMVSTRVVTAGSAGSAGDHHAPANPRFSHFVIQAADRLMRRVEGGFEANISHGETGFGFRAAVPGRQVG